MQASRRKGTWSCQLRVLAWYSEADGIWTQMDQLDPTMHRQCISTVCYLSLQMVLLVISRIKERKDKVIHCLPFCSYWLQKVLTTWWKQKNKMDGLLEMKWKGVTLAAWRSHIYSMQMTPLSSRMQRLNNLCIWGSFWFCLNEFRIFTSSGGSAPSSQLMRPLIWSS